MDLKNICMALFVCAAVFFVCVTVTFLFLPFRVQVEFYVNENTFKERLKLFFIKNQRSSK